MYKVSRKTWDDQQPTLPSLHRYEVAITVVDGQPEIWGWDDGTLRAIIHDLPASTNVLSVKDAKKLGL
jgi:hypothetical protein